MKQDWKGAGSYGMVGLEVVLSVLVGFFGGYWLDGKLDTRPWLTLIGFAYGVAAAARALYRAARRATKEAEDLERREREQRRRYGDERNGN
ncbi:MAG TPA: AtpZ/AtpI family protein [Polyangiaceae bacterium]